MVLWDDDTSVHLFSINCMSWFGRDFRSFGGEVFGNEEEFLTVIKPSELGRVNCIYGDAAVSHFGFYVGCRHLDSTDPLECYASLRDRDHSVASSPDSEDRNLWTDRLLQALKALDDASISELARPDYIANVIRHAGFAFDSRYPFGADDAFIDDMLANIRYLTRTLTGGLITQIPDLVVLS